MSDWMGEAWIAPELASPKIRGVAALMRAVQAWKRQGKTVIFANGCFDGLHGGHVSYLDASRALGDLLIVGVNDDASMRGLKGEGRPIHPLRDRLAVLAALESVDWVTPFSEPTCAPLLELLRPSIHSKGTDYSAETVPERETAAKLGIRVAIAGAQKEHASRAVIARVKEGKSGASG